MSKMDVCNGTPPSVLLVLSFTACTICIRGTIIRPLDSSLNIGQNSVPTNFVTDTVTYYVTELDQSSTVATYPSSTTVLTTFTKQRTEFTKTIPISTDLQRTTGLTEGSYTPPFTSKTGDPDLQTSITHIPTYFRITSPNHGQTNPLMTSLSMTTSTQHLGTREILTSARSTQHRSTFTVKMKTEFPTTELQRTEDSTAEPQTRNLNTESGTGVNPKTAPPTEHLHTESWTKQLKTESRTEELNTAPRTENVRTSQERTNALFTTEKNGNPDTNGPQVTEEPSVWNNPAFVAFFSLMISMVFIALIMLIICCIICHQMKAATKREEEYNRRFISLQMQALRRIGPSPGGFSRVGPPLEALQKSEMEMGYVSEQNWDETEMRRPNIPVIAWL